MRIWSRTTGELLASLPGRGVPSRVVVASTGLVAAVFDDGVVMVWDSSSSRLRWQRQAHAGVGSAMAFESSGRLLATGGADGVVKVWDARSGRILRTFALDDGTVRSVAFDSAGRRVAAAGWWLATRNSAHGRLICRCVVNECVDGCETRSSAPTITR